VPAHALGALVPVLALAVVHLLATHLRGGVGRHELAVVSAAGGISVAYVFLHLLPEVAAGAAVVGESLDGLVAPVPMQEVGVFVVALLGFTVFYLAERFAEHRGSARHGGDPDDATSRAAFVVHLVAFALYNVAVAYTLPERVANDVVGATVFTVAIAVHVLVVDRGLAEHYPRRYGHVGRFVLAGALVVGWLVAGLAAPTSALTVSLMTAVVAGSVLLTVFQEELPRAGRSRLGPFLGGLLGYSVLLVLLTLVDPGLHR
jgi:small-conductance mechanosensitive channel